MGCLFEFIFEVVFEGIFELIFYMIVKLMQLIVPEKSVSDKTKRRLKTAVKAFSAVLFVAMFVGLILMLSDVEPLDIIGNYMLYISAGIVILQTLIGIVVKIVSKIKSQTTPSDTDGLI